MFKSKAINAQGTKLYISDSAGASIAITAITKAAQAVVSSADGVDVGDVIQFGVVTDMPEIEGMTGVVVSAIPGTSFVVDIDTSAFAAAGTAPAVATSMSFIAGCEIKTFNGFDGQSAEISVTTLCSTAQEFLQGLQDFGSFNFDLNLVPDDPFQVECNEAKAAREKRIFKLELPADEAGTVFSYVFEAFVRQFTISGGVDQALAGSVVLRVTGEPQLVES